MYTNFNLHSAYIVAMSYLKFWAKEYGDLSFKAFKTEQSKMNNFQSVFIIGYIAHTPHTYCKM